MTIASTLLGLSLVWSLPGATQVLEPQDSTDYSINQTAPHEYVLDLKENISGDMLGYVKLHNWLHSLNPDDHVTISLHNLGGSIFSGIIVMNAIKNTQASTTADVNGATASMGALIACSAQTVILEPYSFLMYHNGQTSLDGKTSDNRYLLQALDNLDKEMLTECVKKNILKPNQVQDIINGIDQYVFPK